MRLPGGQEAAGLVLREAVFGIVRRLADIERRERARLADAVSRQLDDVDRIRSRSRPLSRHDYGLGILSVALIIALPLIP
jgi:hypothetical protein